MNLIIAIALNIIFLASIYYGFFMGIEPAQNIALFFAWLCIFCSLGGLSEKGKATLRNAPRTIPRSIDVTFDIIATGCFIWHGLWITGICYFLHILIILIARGEHDEKELQVR